MLKVAIIGRPNVGKSTLFNKLCGRKKAIVHNFSGVTRDVKTIRAKIQNKEFWIMDTAGLENAAKDSLEEKMVEKTMMAIREADAIMFMIDMSVGVHPEDYTFANMIRTMNKPTLLLANKCDIKKAKENLSEAYRLGLGEPTPLSAEAKLGFYDIENFVINCEEKLEKPAESDDEDVQAYKDEDKYIKLSIIGRPNVGKSTLINTILGEERFITSDVAGTTRDSVEEYFNYKDNRFKIIDTAGVRKRAKTMKENLEQMTVQQTFENVRFSDIIVLMIDATRGVDKQDLVIASYAVEQGRALIVAINKWDVIKDKKTTLHDIEEKFNDSFHQIKSINFITMSALKNRGVDKVLDFVIEIYNMFNLKISTGKLNGWLNKATTKTAPPLSKFKRPMNLKYITQTAKKPPTFTIFSSGATELPEHYLNYLKKSIAAEFGFQGMPIRFHVRSTENPYKDNPFKHDGGHHRASKSRGGNK